MRVESISSGAMIELSTLLPLAALMLLTGAVGGVLAGLLGVGGGIVIVPVLDVALAFLGVDPAIRMHVAVGTSLATIVPTSISSARAHHAKGAVDMGLVRFWGPLVFVGALLGALSAAWVDSQALAAVFGFVALAVSLKMMFVPSDLSLRSEVPRGVLGGVVPFGIGGVSSWMGIGGGTLSVPMLTLMNQPVHRAVGTSALFGLLISVPAVLGFVYTGWGDERVPALSLGYVNLLGFALISPTTVLLAPLGAKIAHAISQSLLSRLFGVFLLIVAARMLGNAFLG